MAQLVRTVLEEQWAPHTAAQTMLEFTDHDRGVLRRVRAKIALSTLAATSQVADQALATLDLAIGTASEQ